MHTGTAGKEPHIHGESEGAPAIQPDATIAPLSIMYAVQNRVAPLPCPPGCPTTPHVSPAAQAKSRSQESSPETRSWPPGQQLAQSIELKLAHLHHPGSAAQQVMPLPVSRGSRAYSWLARLSIAFCRA